MSSQISKDNKALEKKNSGIELPQGADTSSDIPAGVSEDVYRFWKENGSRIITYSVVALVAFLGVQAWKQYAVSHEVAIREAYAALETTEAKLQFAQSHKGHALAGYAFLTAAKETYEKGDYLKAAQYYATAAKALENPQLESLALLGEASSLKEAGEIDKAVSALDLIASNETFAEGIRAEAMFKRIIIALENGQNDVVDDYTAKLEAIDNTQIWAQRLESIKYYQ